MCYSISSHSFIAPFESCGCIFPLQSFALCLKWVLLLPDKNVCRQHGLAAAPPAVRVAGPFSPGGCFQWNALRFYCGYACFSIFQCLSPGHLEIFPMIEELKLIFCSEQVPSSCHLCLPSSAESMYFLYFLLSLLHSSLYFPKAADIWTKSLGLAFWVLKKPLFGPTYFHTFHKAAIYTLLGIFFFHWMMQWFCCIQLVCMQTDQRRDAFLGNKT